MNYDILFVGKLFPKEKEAEIKSKMRTGMQDAANALQWNIINGLDENHCGTVKIVDQLPVDSYPNGYADKSIPEFVFQHTDRYQSDDKNVACTNITIAKQFLNFSPFRKEVSKWARTDSNRKKVMILYTASPLFLDIARYVKKQYPQVQICCIIADLPEFVCARKLHGIRKLYNEYQAKKSGTLYGFVDKYVLLTKQMAERLNLHVPFMVMEGIAPEDNIPTDDSLARRFQNEKYILYSGTLNYEFGIGTLLEAFSLIEENDLKLIICGFGEAAKAIENMHDDRIVFLGKIDRTQVIPLQRNATVLVNPRQNNEEFTKYSFPSKTMEYLATGVPVVAYKLDGIPDEYDEYIRYVPDNSPESLAVVLKDICALTDAERHAIGEKARTFVRKEKNYRKQTQKMLEFIDS